MTGKVCEPNIPSDLCPSAERPNASEVAMIVLGDFLVSDLSWQHVRASSGGSAHSGVVFTRKVWTGNPDGVAEGSASKSADSLTANRKVQVRSRGWPLSGQSYYRCQAKFDGRKARYEKREWNGSGVLLTGSLQDY
jgi:hypothetical protein